MGEFVRERNLDVPAITTASTVALT
jgi:hypothetical protein